jgi:hypothetical protein
VIDQFEGTSVEKVIGGGQVFYQGSLGGGVDAGCSSGAEIVFVVSGDVSTAGVN